MSLLSFKRELNRTQYWLSIMGVILLLYPAYYLASPLLVEGGAELPIWREYLAIGLAIVGMYFWMGTVASRYYMLKSSPVTGALAALFPFLNIIVTILAGVVSAKLPGKEEKPLNILWYLPFVLLFLYLFFTANEFQAARDFLQELIIGVVVLLLIGYMIFSKSSSSGSTSSRVSTQPNDNGMAKNTKHAASKPQVKQVGLYIVNEGGYADQKIKVYSDGQSYMAESNNKDIKSDSFRALEPLIYATFKGHGKFKVIEAQIW